tara:strand:+ start:4581 stop:5060 length:480 start_codon:yes stop_codon:yes gene_type:complete
MDNVSDIIVELTPFEMCQAGQAGVMRQVENLKLNRKPYYGAGSSNDWQLHIEGCLGEMALAKHLKLYWSGKGKFRDLDVGDFDVRTSQRDWGDLILHDKDDDEKIFWSVAGKNGKYRINGWIKAKDGKKKEFWKDPAGGRPAYFVPRTALKSPIEKICK